MKSFFSYGPVVYLGAFLFLLLLRDVPYLNIIFVNKLWILYLILLFIIFFSFIEKKFEFISNVMFVLYILGIILTFLHAGEFAETAGVVVYVAFWILLVRRFMSL